MSLVVRSQLLTATGRLIQGATTEAVGNLSYAYGKVSEVKQARRAAFRALGTQPGHAVVFRPLDRDIIVDVDATYGGLGVGPTLPLRADALVTRTPGVGLFLLLADCQGVTLYDPVRQVVALAHCGRKSTDLQLAKKLVTYMVSEYDCKVENLLAYLGPTIAPEHYVFDSWIRDNLDHWGTHLRLVGEGRYAVDINGYNQEQLRLAGLKPKQIEASGIDTYSSPRFYSHVRSAQDGVPEQRFAAYVELRS